MPLDMDERVWLGKYELLYRLGAGGMAELFLARTTAIHGFEKLVALKRVLAKHADNNQLIEMLLSEARLAASLHHPNIVQVYDVGEDQGDYFFTMEYVQGRDLRRLLRAANRRGVWMPIEHLINVMIHAAAGLHYAHERDAPDGTILGIVHRDISPSNIIVSFDGTVKVVDFGIAKAATSRESTQGGRMGKVPYMSPEQCRGEAVDRRSDIFSLGIILWELSLGRRLFNNLKGKPLIEYIGKTQAPRPSTFKPDYPQDLPPTCEGIALSTGDASRLGSTLAAGVLSASEEFVVLAARHPRVSAGLGVGIGLVPRALAGRRRPGRRRLRRLFPGGIAGRGGRRRGGLKGTQTARGGPYQEPEESAPQAPIHQRAGSAALLRRTSSRLARGRVRLSPLPRRRAHRRGSFRQHSQAPGISPTQLPPFAPWILHRSTQLRVLRRP